MMEIWRNLDGPPKNKELWSYVVKYEFSRPEGSSAAQYITDNSHVIPMTPTMWRFEFSSQSGKSWMVHVVDHVGRQSCWQYTRC